MRFRGACGGLVPPRKCCWCGEPTDERPPESIGCCEHCGRPACGYECRVRHEERCGAGREAAFQCMVEAAAEFMNLSTRGPRGEARFTGHARRRTGAEAFTVAGVGVRVSQTFGRWGKTMIIRRGQEASLCSSSQIAAKLRRPAHSSLAPKNAEVPEFLKEMFARLAPRLDGPEDERPLSAFQELQGPEKVSEKEVCEVPSRPRPRRPPFDPEVV